MIFLILVTILDDHMSHSRGSYVSFWHGIDGNEVETGREGGGKRSVIIIIIYYVIIYIFFF